MNPSRKKSGEKAVLLQACGEELFRCEGENKVTQGIYVVRKGRKLECFCKRAVWVPIDPKSIETLKMRFDEFGAAWPSFLDDVAMVGVCGRNATRTAHATDSTFLILALHPKMKFVAVGIVRVDYGTLIGDTKPDISITGITSDPSQLEDCIEWIRKESTAHENNKSVKRPREKNVSLDDRVMVGVVSELNALKRCRLPDPEPVLPPAKRSIIMGTETSSDIMPTTPLYVDDYGFQLHDNAYDVSVGTYYDSADALYDVAQPVYTDVLASPCPQDAASTVANPVIAAEHIFNPESEYGSSPDHAATLEAFPFLGNDPSYSTFTMFHDYAS